MMNSQNSRRSFLLALAAAGTSLAAGQVFAQDTSNFKEPVLRVAAAGNITERLDSRSQPRENTRWILH